MGKSKSSIFCYPLITPSSSHLRRALNPPNNSQNFPPNFPFPATQVNTPTPITLLFPFHLFKGSSRKGSSRKSGRDSAEKKEPMTLEVIGLQGKRKS
ncbi:hypothetical protein ES332_A07G161200v1 [Gossypium tomentosum]|uniref:Uncharacterized protein n=1 Tax=Gossypium tomentosum TaxID=34277 RepID=A0A5D2PT95_GOSTO|nr:hypothetical protein ES332_A07G161200v1 [Gossypium tomentosum]